MKTFCAAIIALSSMGCATPLIPAWQGKIYAGDPVTRAMVRKQANESIASDSAAFADLRCFTSSGLREFWRSYVLSCEKWSGDRVLMPAKELP